MSELSEVKEAIYGHEILGIVGTRSTPWPEEELRVAVASAFGTGAVFQNCHGSRFDFDELLGFLSSKGKLAVQDGKVSLGVVPGCSGH
jgi:probable metal-binding protein